MEIASVFYKVKLEYDIRKLENPVHKVSITMQGLLSKGLWRVRYFTFSPLKGRKAQSVSSSPSHHQEQLPQFNSIQSKDHRVCRRKASSFQAM